MKTKLLVVGLGSLAVASAFADFYFKATDGQNDWGYTNSWYTDSGRTAPSTKLPDNSSNIYIPAGEDVLATNIDTKTINLFVGSTAGGVGKLTLGTGTKLWPGFNSYYIGNVAGSTGVLHIAKGGQVYGEADGGLQNFYIGRTGYGVVTNQGSMFTREQSVIGVDAGSYGKYVHDGGTWSRCFGSKVLCVGQNGVGEVEVLSGTFDANNPELILGGNAAEPSVLTVRTGAKIIFGHLMAGGGYGSYGSTIWRFLDAQAKVVLEGGTMVTKSSSTANFQLGAYTGSVVRAVADQKQFGELRGYGTVGGSEQSVYINLGRGLIEADGGTLDLNAVSRLTNCLAPYNACLGKLSAVNGGDIRFPRRSFSAASASLNIGCTPAGTVPDIPGAAHVTIAGAAASGEKYIRGGICANDVIPFPQEKLTRLEGQVLGCWRFGLFADGTSWTAEKAASFATATVQFKYDRSLVTDATKPIYVYRRINGNWCGLGRADVNDEGLVTTPALTPVADAVYNIGEFAVVQHLKGGLTVSLQ